MILRPASAEDAPALARVHVQSWRESYARIVPAKFLKELSESAREEDWRKRLQAPSGGRFNWVAEGEDGEVVGFASGGPLRTDWGGNAKFAGTFPEALKSFDGECYAAYLLKSHQGRGIGRAMFQKVRSNLKEQGFLSMLVWVLKANPTAGFYKRMGGKEVGEAKIVIGKELEQLALGWDTI